jgi:hypothetical protein
MPTEHATKKVKKIPAHSMHPIDLQTNPRRITTVECDREKFKENGSGQTMDF